MDSYTVFWGETHDNTYQFSPAKDSISQVLSKAASHLDFYAAAYYTSQASAFEEGGHQSEKESASDLILEGWKEDDRLNREWAEVQAATREKNEPGSFVTFPGYEWQGDGSPGDHNVYAFEEGLPIFKVNTLSELYERLRGHNALAIPHHTAYRPGRRGRDWSVYDERLSPFAEVYSVHGSSETDEELIGMRSNFYMGPGQAGGTYQDALDRGYRLGAVCSTDNWGDMPGHYGNGRMACLATELTRAGLWEAFNARRVYGVTGDRIGLDFRVNDAEMGSVLQTSGKRRITVQVTGSDALDRIEILRNGKVIHTHCHQGSWELPRPGMRSRYKMRVEAGWGPRQSELAVADHAWDGTVRIDEGRILSAEPCWISPQPGRPEIDSNEASFRMISPPDKVKEPHQNANVFELEGDVTDSVHVSLNGNEVHEPISELASGSRVLWYRDECVRLLEEQAGIPANSPEREDVYYLLGYKAKIHRVIPEAGYTATVTIDDDDRMDGEWNYRVRVEQRNGQRAWSSPIWVHP